MDSRSYSTIFESLQDLLCRVVQRTRDPACSVKNPHPLRHLKLDMRSVPHTVRHLRPVVISFEEGGLHPHHKLLRTKNMKHRHRRLLDPPPYRQPPLRRQLMEEPHRRIHQVDHPIPLRLRDILPPERPIAMAQVERRVVVLVHRQLDIEVVLHHYIDNAAERQVPHDRVRPLELGRRRQHERRAQHPPELPGGAVERIVCDERVDGVRGAGRAHVQRDVGVAGRGDGRVGGERVLGEDDGAVEGAGVVVHEGEGGVWARHGGAEAVAGAAVLVGGGVSDKVRWSGGESGGLGTYRVAQDGVALEGLLLAEGVEADGVVLGGLVELDHDGYTLAVAEGEDLVVCE